MESPDKTLSLKIVRNLSATPEEVFDIFTNPENMKVWWTETTTFDIDLRIGGKWTIIRKEAETVYTATGEYLEVKSPHRLSYTYCMPQFSPNFDTISIDIAADEASSVVTFTVTGKDIAKELSGLSEREISHSEQGWNQMFDLMAAHWDEQNNSDK